MREEESAHGMQITKQTKSIHPAHIHTTYILRRWLPVLPLAVLAVLAVLALVAAGAPTAATKHGSTRQRSGDRRTVQRHRTWAARRRCSRARTHKPTRADRVCVSQSCLPEGARRHLRRSTCCASSAAPTSAGAPGRIPAGALGRIRTGCSRTWPRSCVRPFLPQCALAVTPCCRLSKDSI